MTIVFIEKLCSVDRGGVVNNREDANLQVHNHHVLMSNIFEENEVVSVILCSLVQ